jgi:hypothetical protein
MIKKISIAIFFIVLISGISISFLKIVLIKYCTRYTLGITENIYNSGRTGMRIKYSYTVNGKMYESASPVKSGSSPRTNGGYYIVEYAECFESFSNLLLDFEIDSLLIVPDNGWDKNPISDSHSDL